MRKTPTRCPRASGSPSSRRSLRAADGAWAVSPMPRFTFVSGCEKLAPVMIKGRLLAHAAVFVPLILAAPAGASAQTAPPTLGILANQVLALFPKVDGEVLEVQGTTVTLSLGQRDGLVAGVELTAYREGRELRHPKTGEILGRTEEVLGRVAVHQVQEAYDGRGRRGVRHSSRRQGPGLGGQDQAHAAADRRGRQGRSGGGGDVRADRGAQPDRALPDGAG